MHHPQNLPKDTTNTNVAISTLLVSYIMKTFQFDNLYYGMIYGLVSQILASFTFQDIIPWVENIYNNMYNNIIYLPLLLIFVILGYYFKIYCFPYLKKRMQNEYMTINIYNDSHIQQVMQYITHNKQYYDNSVNLNIGDSDTKSNLLSSQTTTRAIDSLQAESEYVSHEINSAVKFNDHNLGVEGYYVWRKIIKDVKDLDQKVTKQTYIKYIEYNILKKGNQQIVLLDIIENMCEYVTNLNKNQIILKYIKVMTAKDKTSYNHVVTFHSGIRESFEILEEKFMKPFFHQEKDRLWSVIKNVCMNPDFYRSKGQVARVSLLLYGPPGTGKSSFAHRIATCFERHIVSLDLRGLTKQNIYQVLQKPSIEGSLESSYKNTVFLFEEFDISIKELYLREQKSSHSSNAHYSKMFLKYRDFHKHNDHINEEDSVNVDEDKYEKYDYFEDNQFKLRDLLEIFQGPVPFESMITIANTNKYDEIKEMCPELFRPGRITPVYFGYVDKTTLQDISKYYFGKKLAGYIPDVLTVPTSQIIDIAIESLTFSDTPYEYFNDSMNKLMSR